MSRPRVPGEPVTYVGDPLESHPGLTPEVVEHLRTLLGDWQILADLSFADLLLFVEAPGWKRPPTYLCVGQMRPYTAQTVYTEDLVGRVFTLSERPMVGQAFAEQRLVRDADPDWTVGVPVREEAIPVRFRDGIVAVVTREANVSSARSPSQLELTYLRSAADLAQMLAEGTFPYATVSPEGPGLSPRVGDGVIRLDAEGTVVYASPNAISAYRRLGSLDDIVGQRLSDFDEGAGELLGALEAGEPLDNDLEREGAAVTRRLLPLLRSGAVVGALLLVREVTEVRRHERELRVKDATIREIHHRVKNNLQTVASLLRLQGRRLRSEEARQALDESVRRISSIALVHETLSQDSRQRADFRHVSQRVVDMLADGLGDPEVPIEFRVEGDPGELPAEVASPLALVLAELLQNSVEHGYPAATGPRRGAVVVRYERDRGSMRVEVSDDGVGLPADQSLDGLAKLGLRIARTLVESELGGTLRAPPRDRGTTVELVIPLP